MNQIDLSFEGGPIVIGSARKLSAWRGIETEDYGNLCALFDSDFSKKVHSLHGHLGDCIAVDFGGPGSVRVLSNGKDLSLVRAWPVDPDSDAFYTEAIEAKPDAWQCGEIDHTSETLAIAWAVESLAGIPSDAVEPFFPEMDLALENSVLLQPLDCGKYTWTRSEIERPNGAAIRLTIQHE